MSANQFRVPMLVFCFFACFGCSHDIEERIWVSITQNGCKPGTALVLSEKAGSVASATFYILDPNNPHDLARGKCYSLSNLSHTGNIIRGDECLVDGSSKTGTKDVHLAITLKEPLKASAVRAEVQDGEEAKQEIVFERK